MPEDLNIVSGTKEERYISIIPQIAGLLEGEYDLIANLGNVSAALKEQFNFLWVGFYLVKGDELVLGPFQGPVACTRIKKGKGVCGHSWAQRTAIVVPNVDAYPGHIACSSASRSEIVIPLLNSDGEVVAVLDVDSENLREFTTTDEQYLTYIINLIPFHS
jgi:L-methionine (R)-S-oxide reductase